MPRRTTNSNLGFVIRRIIGKTIVKGIKTDHKILGGDQRKCMGQKRGIEHAIHSLRASSKLTDSEAILMIDVKNAFNSLNRDHAIRSGEKLCPCLYHSICNSYREPSNLLINKQTKSLRKVQSKANPLRCRCLELPFSLN